MDQATRDSLVTGNESIIPSLSLPDPDDQHVLAAAIVGHCDVIVTQNLRDFPTEELGLCCKNFLEHYIPSCSICVSAPYLVLLNFLATQPKQRDEDSVLAMTQKSEHVCYLPMSLACHNPKEVACLIYESAPELFALMFGSHAIADLTDLVQRAHSRFSHQYIRVAAIDHQVVGVAILVPAASVNDAADYGEILNLIRKLWLKLVQYLLLQRMLQHNYPVGTFYVGNLAVAAEYRNQGIGRQLLSQCIAEAKATFSSIFISVDISNVRAQKLYESLGFQVVATKTISLFGSTIGSRILSISNHSRQHKHDN
ncbi:MAG: GNAT family N-acetyltransferase [Chroococcidiopsidaceae cyanobacterium CP_BM_RX_35]|nr:GNAT family N-acetyltransferase [Chroococcidiopsidaceae cyanobacterium CP_BM_RX_35]